MFAINVKAPSGSRITVTESEVAKVEALIRQIVPPEELGLILSNIGVTPGFSSIYTSNSAAHTAFVQVSLKDGHKVGSYEYMARVKRKLAEEMPELNTYFQSGGMVDAVVNLGLPAPIDVQVSGSNLERSHQTAQQLAAEIQRIPGVADVYIPQDIDYPALKLDVDRTRASELGLDQQEVVGNVITALTSNQMIAPSYWVDPKSGQDYMLTVQYSEGQVKSLADLRAIPPAGCGQLTADSPRLDQFGEARPGAHRGGSLPDPPRNRHLCAPTGRGIGEHRGSHRRNHCAHQGSRRPLGHASRDGAGHAHFFSKLRSWIGPRGCIAVFDSGGAVQKLRRSFHYFARRAPRIDRRAC